MVQDEKDEIDDEFGQDEILKETVQFTESLIRRPLTNKSSPSRFKRTFPASIEPEKQVRWFPDYPKEERFIRQAPVKADPMSFPVVYSSTHSAIPVMMVLPSPFRIYSRGKELGYYVEPLTLRYGQIEMILSGQKLNIRDQNVFIALLQQAYEKKSLDLVYPGLIESLAHKIYNSYTKETKESIKKCVDHMVEGNIRITIYNDKGKIEIWFKGHLIDYEGGRGEETKVHINEFFNQIFGLFGEFNMTSVNPKYRLALKGDITKQIYWFGQRQVSAQGGQQVEYRPYSYGFGLFCDLIGLPWKNKPIKVLRHQIKKNLEKLRKAGYLRSFDPKALKNNKVSMVIDGKKALTYT